MVNKMVTIRSYYGTSPSAENNAKVVTVKGTRFFFSYETLVGVESAQGPVIVHENIWGTTTGKHLNSIDGGTKDAKAKRLNHDDFMIAIKDFL
jgi:hypothetical protein